MKAHSRDRILIVEDDQIVALDLQATLAELGYALAGHASDAESALHLVGETQPDLVLMDINLKSRYDGIHAARHISSTWNIPVVFATAYDDEATVVQAQVTEPYGYILKPFNPREIRICIQMALFHHAMQGERDRLRAELEVALSKNHIPQGIVTVCAQCRKVRDPDGEWIDLEAFLQSRTNLKFSHGCCSGCEKDFLRPPSPGVQI